MAAIPAPSKTGPLGALGVKRAATTYMVRGAKFQFNRANASPMQLLEA